MGKLDNDAAAKWLHGITKDNALKGVYANLYWNKDGTLGEVTLIPYQVKGGQFVAFKTS